MCNLGNRCSQWLFCKKVLILGKLALIYNADKAPFYQKKLGAGRQKTTSRKEPPNKRNPMTKTTNDSALKTRTDVGGGRGL